MSSKNTIRVKAPGGDVTFDAATDGQLEELISISLPSHGKIDGIPAALLGAITAELRSRREQARAENPRVRIEHFVLEIGATPKSTIREQNESD